MRLRCGGALLFIGANLLSACKISTDAGYVEVKTTMAPSASDLYALNSEPLTAFQEGRPADVVLREPVGPVTLTVEREAEQYRLCTSLVMKNRIVTMTVSVVNERLHCTVE